MQIFLVILLNLCCLVLLRAQTDVEAIKYREVMRSAEKRDLIGRALQLSMLEASVFWPAYETYEASRRKISTTYAIRINEYAKSYPFISEKKLHRQAKQFIFYEKQLYDLHNLYYKRLRKALGSAKADKFIQLEVRIQNAITYEAQTNIPFINEVETYVISNGKNR